MTGSGIDVTRRRRLIRLRQELGVSHVPPNVGYELHSITDSVCAEVAARLDRSDAAPQLSPESRRQLLTVVARAVTEFAQVVENRPSAPPSVESLIVEVVRDEGRERCLLALETAHEVVRAQWSQLVHAQRLDVALDRYVERLRARIAATPGPRTAAPRTSAGPGDVGLLPAQVAARWCDTKVELYVSVASPGATCAAPQRDHADSICLVVDDHVVTVSTHAAPPLRPLRSPQPPVVVTTGPVAPDQVTQLHDTLLLLMRLIRAGVASPPTPAVIPLPDLGFLHPDSGPASVRAIADLLRPLTGQGPLRRAVLARTLRLRLRTAMTSRALGDQLGTHPQTVCNHLSALRDLYNQELDFSGDALAIRAALDLVLPLWELEAAAGQRSTRGARRPTKPVRPSTGLPQHDGTFRSRID